MTTITTTVSNVCANPLRPMPDVRARIKQVADIPGVSMGQEIQNADYDAAWDSAMRGAGKTTFNQKLEIPISLPDSVWRNITADSIRVHGGLAGISPSRFISWVKATRVSGEKVAFVNCHPVSKPRLLVPSGRWRIARHKEYMAALTKVVTDLRTEGYTVVFGGDMNKTAPPEVHPLQRTLISKGLDHLWVVPAANYKVSAIKTQVIDRTKLMDHPILSANFTLAKIGAPVTPPPVEVPVPVKTTDRLAKILKAEVGYREGRSNGHWNNVEKYDDLVPGLEWVDNERDGQAWCAVFVSWGYQQAGLKANVDYPVTAAVRTAKAWYQACGRYSEYPAIGAQVIFDPSHTGTVIAFDADTITTIEGNTNTNGSREGDGVYLKTHQRRSAKVVGYGYPRFPEGIVSADPKWQDAPTAPKPDPKPTAAGWPIDGIDLSHWNSGKIDWTKAKTAGVKFVYHKATEHLSMVDDAYATRRSEVKAQGLPFGAYHFARPNVSSGTRQAQFFLAVAKPVKGDMRCMLDLEDRGGLSDVALDQWVAEFVAEVKRVTGLNPIIYTAFDLRSRHGCYLWTARYSNANAAPTISKPWSATGWTVHQFSNGEFGVPQRCPGIPFPCDLNTLAPGFDLDRLRI